MASSYTNSNETARSENSGKHRIVHQGRDNYYDKGGNYHQVSLSNNQNGQDLPPRLQKGNADSYCTERLEVCKDASCLKHHLESEFELTYRTNAQLSPKMKWNISKALRQIDKDIKEARLAFVKSSIPDSGSDNGGSKNKAEEALAAKLFELIAQRHAFCTRAFESLWLTTLNHFEFASVIWRDLYRLNGRLPALAKRLDFEVAVRSNDFVIVVGETGSGKSTQIPQYLHDMPVFHGKKVYCTQPRRVGAVSLAERVAQEYAGGYEPLGTVGRNIGFQIGGLSNRSKFTMIEYMTEGILVHHLAENFSSDTVDHLNDKDRISLSNCAAIVVDEVHERSCLSDFLLGLLKAKKKDYPDLKIIVSSATIDNDKFSRYLGGCPVIEIPGKTFPVTIKYEPHRFHAEFKSKKELLVSAVVAKAIEILATTSDGHVLCFLTGQFETEKAREKMWAWLGTQRDKAKTTNVYVLFGKQTPEEQAEAVKPCDLPKRKVIFSTDVAETSLTVDGVRYLVDCGYAKDVVYDSNSNLMTLKVFQISKSSADQRAGRAGRTQPGFCYRLYSTDFYNSMEPFPQPEIQRRSLALTVATLIGIGKNPYDFDWIDAPDKAAVSAAENELRLLGIIEGPISCATLTDVGRTVCSLQVDPSLGRMIYYACRDGFGLAAATIVSLMTSGVPLFSTAPKARRSTYASQKGEIVSAYRAFCDWLALKEKDDLEANKKLAEERAKAKDEEKKKDINDQAKQEGVPQHDSENPAQGQTVPADEAEGEHFDQVGESYSDDKDDVGQLDMFLPDEIGDADIGPVEETLSDSLPTSQRIKDWAKQNAASSDACYMAYLERKSLVKRLQFRGIWKMFPVQDNAPTDEDICRLALLGLAMNIAKLEVPHKWQYRVLTNNVRCQIFPLVLPRSVCRFAPQWIVFHEATQPAASESGGGHPPTYLQKATPIETSWVFEDGEFQKFPQQFQNLLHENIHDYVDEDSCEYFSDGTSPDN